MEGLSLSSKSMNIVRKYKNMPFEHLYEHKFQFDASDLKQVILMNLRSQTFGVIVDVLHSPVAIL